MTRDAVVLAAGLGTRLRPITQRWAKPVLPIDGRAVLATLMHELVHAGFARVWLVTGHLAGQVEALVGDGSAFGLDVETVRQPTPDGSADALRRALEAGAPAPCVLTAADTVYARGDVGLFARAWHARGAAGAIAVRSQPGRPAATRLRVDGDRVVLVRDPGSTSETTAAPLMAVGEAVAREIDAVCRPPFRPPYEVADAFQRVIDAGERVAAVEIGRTRDLTTALDLVEENFPYLRAL